MKPFYIRTEHIDNDTMIKPHSFPSVEALMRDEAMVLIESTDESMDDTNINFKYESNENDAFNHPLLKDSLSSSPFHSYIQSDTESLKHDDDTYEYPSLYPKYTNDTFDSSNVSMSTQSARSSTSFLHNNIEISTTLIYDTMDTYAASMYNDEEDQSCSFFIIDDEEDEDCNYDDYYSETEDDLNIETLLSVPKVDVDNILTLNDNEEIYDEDGDHSIYIPSEFRSLHLNIKETDNTTRKYNSKRRCKKHIPPMHIQQKIKINKAIKQLRCDLTPKNIVNIHFDVQSPLEYDDDQSLAFYTQSNEAQHEKKFKWNINPNNVRISDEACLHLVNLVEYQTDIDDDM